MSDEGYSSEQWDIIKTRISRIVAYYTPHPGTTTWYVDQVDGSDTTGDGTEDHPYQTLTKAESVAGPRDTIIGWGAFSEDLVINVVGLRLIGLGKGLSTLSSPTADTPAITQNADGIEITGFIIDGSAATGHGIRIIDSDDFHIHDNEIRNITGAYDGINKSSGGVNKGKIDRNTIRNGARAGINLANFDNGKVRENIVLANAAEGILIAATSDANVIKDNIANKNDEGIEVAGSDNHLDGNVMRGNTTADWVDSGGSNIWGDIFEKHKDLMKPYYDPGDGGVATITGGVAANAFGSWVQMIALTGNKSWLIGIECELDQVDIYTIEVGVGGAGSEVAIAEVVFEAQAADTTIHIDSIERYVEKGSRVSIRIKTVGGGSDTISNTMLRWKSM